MMSTSSSSPIVEYTHDLLDASGKWATQWKQGDVHVCWYDGHIFDWFPVPLPTSYDEVRRTYRVFGKFCCFQCAKAWQINNSSFNTPIARAWLAVMAKELFGYKNSVIHPAPEKWVLLSGKVNIDTFREQCKTNVLSETVHPPLLPACMASISGATSEVLASICTTRNNETLSGGGTQNTFTNGEQTTGSQMSVYEKYLSKQQPHVAEAEEAKETTGEESGESGSISSGSISSGSISSGSISSGSSGSISSGSSGSRFSGSSGSRSSGSSGRASTTGVSAASSSSSVAHKTKKTQPKTAGTLANYMRKK